MHLWFIGPLLLSACAALFAGASLALQTPRLLQPPAAGPQAEAERDSILGVALAICALMGALLAMSAPPHVDDAWLLHVAQRMLAGDVFGREIFETNPPLILLFAVPARLIASMTGGDGYAAYVALICVILAASSYLSARLLAPLGYGLWARRLFAIALFATLLFAPGENFGQREHVLIALALPFLLIEIVRLTTNTAPSTAIQCGTAALAALGFLLKPHYVIAAAALIVARAVQVRRWQVLFARPYLVMVAMAALYALVLLLFFPDWVRFAEQIVAPGYSAAGDTPWLWVIWYTFKDAAFLALVIALCWLAPNTAARRAAWWMLGVATLLLAAAVLQHKTWAYHRLPARITECAALLLLMLDPGAATLRAKQMRIAAGVCAAAFVLTFDWGERYFQRHFDLTTPIAGVIRDLHGAPFLAIDTYVDDFFPLTNDLNANWAGRMSHQWLPPGAGVLIDDHDPAKRAEGQRLRTWASQRLAEDIVRRRPAIILVYQPQSRPDYRAPLGDWVRWFSADPAFAAAWRNYCPDRVIDKWMVYRPCARK